MSTPPPEPLTETDDRFPSGPWFGYYQQRGIQARQRLALRFSNGAITGTGGDPGGACSVKGHYDIESGRISLVKVYEAHRVEYEGAADGDGIGGAWVIHYPMGITDRGVFRIWPDELAMGPHGTAVAEAPAGA